MTNAIGKITSVVWIQSLWQPNANDAGGNFFQAAEMGNIAFSRGYELANWNKIKAGGDTCVVTILLLLAHMAHMYSFKNVTHSIWVRHINNTCIYKTSNFCINCVYKPPLHSKCLGNHHGNAWTKMSTSVEIIDWKKMAKLVWFSKQDEDGCQPAVFIGCVMTGCSESSVIHISHTYTHTHIHSHTHTLTHSHTHTLTHTKCPEIAQFKKTPHNKYTSLPHPSIS